MDALFKKIVNFDFSFAEQIYIMMGFLLVMVLVCLVLIVVLSVKYKRLRNHVENGEPVDETIYDESQDFFEEEVIENGAENAPETVNVDEINEKFDNLEAKQQKFFDKIKVLRYNQTSADGETFECYSIGLMNAERNGIVLTGVETGSGATKLTVKSIRDGNSNVELSEAEKVAIRRKGEKTC